MATAARAHEDGAASAEKVSTTTASTATMASNLHSDMVFYVCLNVFNCLFYCFRLLIFIASDLTKFVFVVVALFALHMFHFDIILFGQASPVVVLLKILIMEDNKLSSSFYELFL